MTRSVQRIEEVRQALASDARVTELYVEPGPALCIRCQGKTIYVSGHDQFNDWCYFLSVRNNDEAAAFSASWFPYAARDFMIERIRRAIDARAA